MRMFSHVILEPVASKGRACCIAEDMRTQMHKFGPKLRLATLSPSAQRRTSDVYLRGYG